MGGIIILKMVIPGFYPGKSMLPVRQLPRNGTPKHFATWVGFGRSAQSSDSSLMTNQLFILSCCCSVLECGHSSPRMDNVPVSCFEVAWIQFLLMDFYFYFQGGEGTWEWSESIRNCLACVWSPENTPDSHCAWLYQQVESTPGEVHLSPGSVASVSIGNFLKKKFSNEICLSARVAESTIVAQGLGIVSL